MELNYLTDTAETGDDSREELQGRIRAFEAILLELADTSTLRAAKERLRIMAKREQRSNRWAELQARLADQRNQPYDKHAERFLDALIREAEKTNS